MLTQTSPHTNLVLLTDILEAHRPRGHQEYRVFLQAILDGLTDGVLLLTAAGEQIYANHKARQICAQLSDITAQTLGVSRAWEMLETMIDRCSAVSQPPFVVETEIKDRTARLLRVRARWLDLKESKPYLLIILEDYNQSLQNLAIAEAIKYKLTPREAEIWLLRRLGHTYKDITTQLYISLNTVKKHLKNIHAKQEAILDQAGAC